MGDVLGNLVDHIYIFHIPELQRQTLAVAEHLNSINAVLVRNAGCHSFAIVVELLNAPVNSRFYRTGHDCEMGSLVQIVAVNENHIQRPHISRFDQLALGFSRAGKVHNLGVFCAGDLLCQTIQGSTTVEGNDIAFYLNYVEALGHFLCNGSNVLCINNIAIVIKHQANSIHSVDVVDQTLVGEDILHLLTVMGKCHMIFAVCARLTGGHAGSGIRKRCFVDIPINIGAAALGSVVLIAGRTFFCRSGQNDAQNNANNSQNSNDGNDQP